MSAETTVPKSCGVAGHDHCKDTCRTGRRDPCCVDCLRARAEAAEAALAEERNPEALVVTGIDKGGPITTRRCDLIPRMNRGWERAFEAEAENAALRAENERLKAACEKFALLSIEARNPGIDMERVRASRAATKGESE